MANLARNLMNAGFFDEAREIIADANKRESPHKNVASAITALNDKEDTEAKEWQALTDEANQLREHGLRYVDAYLSIKSDPSAFAGRWSLDTGPVVDSHVDGDSLKAEWMYEVPPGLFGLIRTGPTRYEASLEGRVFGRSAELTYRKTRAKDGPGTGLLETLESENIQCLSYLTEDLEEWHVFPKGRENLHLTFRKSPRNK